MTVMRESAMTGKELASREAAADGRGGGGRGGNGVAARSSGKCRLICDERGERASMKQFRNPQDVHAPLGAYAHQVELHGERLIAMSGQVGMDESGTVPEGTIAQLGLALDNV